MFIVLRQIRPFACFRVDRKFEVGLGKIKYFKKMLLWYFFLLVINNIDLGLEWVPRSF